MKKYRMLVPIVLAVLLAVSWYMLLDNSSKEEDNYQAYLTEARNQAKKGVTVEAKKNYIAALNVKQTPEIYAECANFLKEQNKTADWISWCLSFQDEYPKEPLAYECLMDAYYTTKDYEACYDTIETARKRKVTSEYVNQIAEQIEYEFTLDFNTYGDVSIFSNNFCAVKKKESWGFVNRFGDQRIACKYESVGVFTQSGFAPVIRDGAPYFVNKDGEKILASENTYLRFGQLVDDLIPAQKSDGRYVYLNGRMEEVFGDYEYAASFNGGIAAVKNNGKWMFVDKTGQQIIPDTYADVAFDEKEIAFRTGRAFVSQDGSVYHMIDSKGTKIGSLEFEDARVFTSTDPTAVKIDGKWCFVNTDGAKISDKCYDDARPFTNELAAVCVDGKWGFIDKNEEMVIAAQFQGAKDFNEKGSCFVKNGEQWQLLKLYRLNRED